jgi:4'-phosphopantetheinyl transferase
LFKLMVNSNFNRQLLLTLAGPTEASRYSADALSPEDAGRAARPRSPKAEQDWQVSRALLHACRGHTRAACAESLSHSHGHALLAQAPSDWRIGVDMEMIRPRRVLVLADWACSAGEIEWLRSRSDAYARLRCFYMLWTLKEAFIKAAGLAFPADLRRYGLDGGIGQPLSLRAPAGAWRAGTYFLEPHWIASAVWLPATEGMDEPPQWRAGPASTLPAVAPLGAWTHR